VPVSGVEHVLYDCVGVVVCYLEGGGGDVVRDCRILRVSESLCPWRGYEADLDCEHVGVLVPPPLLSSALLPSPPPQPGARKRALRHGPCCCVPTNGSDLQPLVPVRGRGESSGARARAAARGRSVRAVPVVPPALRHVCQVRLLVVSVQQSSVGSGDGLSGEDGVLSDQATGCQSTTELCQVR